MVTVVDKGIPIPEPTGKRVAKYPAMSRLEPGDSTFFPGATIESVCQAAYGRRIRHGHRYTARKVTEKGVQGIRVWRTV